ncbi:MAG: pyridoxal 5'-phosphate synthase glutaminase subunit PdxT [Chloroflexota bacterium]
MKKIGVLALQGAFVEHEKCLTQIGAEAILIRLPRQIEQMDGLIIPGGESSSISRLMNDYELTNALQRHITDGLPVFGICAGMILLAREAIGLREQALGAMDIVVRRNAFGRQVDSFEIDLPVPALGEPPFHAVFIRAPWIEDTGPDVEILAKLPDGTPVAARQRNILVASFHPELTNDTRFHAYFLSMAERREKCRK